MGDIRSRRPFPSALTLLHCLAWAILLAALLGIVVTAGAGLKDFSPDSWSYWELARSVFGEDFFRVEVRRQFQFNSPYSVSFPPLWPVLVALGAEATRYEPFIMPVLAGLFAFATFVLLESAFRVQNGLPGVGLVTGLGMLSFGGYVDEIGAGRSMPLAMFCIAVIIALAMARPTNWRAFAMGLTAGLMVMTRFDALPVAAALWLLIGTGFMTRQPAGWSAQVRLAALFGAGLLLAVLPYVAYNFSHFGTPWKSDNSRIVMSSVDVLVTEFHSVWPPTALEEPLLWLRKTLGNMMRYVPRFLGKSGWMVAAGLGAIWLANRRPDARIWASVPVRPIVLIALISIMALSVHAAVGYNASRYQSAAFLTGLVLFAVGLSFRLSRTPNGRRVFVALQLVAAVLVTAQLVRKSSIDATALTTPPTTVRELTRDLPQVDLCLEPNSSGSILVLADDTLAARMGALADGHEILMMPANLEDMPDATLQEFLGEYNVGSVLTTVADPRVANILGRLKRMIPELTECEQLRTLWVRERGIRGAAQGRLILAGARQDRR